MAQGAAFDVVLLDLNLPDSEGLDTLTRMLDTAKDVPIVVLTGGGDEGQGVQAIRMGAQDYFPKGKLDSSWVGRALRYAIQRHVLLALALGQVRKFSNLFHHAPDGMVLLDPAGRIVLLNTAAEDILGGQRADLVGGDLGFEVQPGENGEIESTGARGSLTVQVRSATIDWDGQPHLLVMLHQC
jgi:CheY-like chemotaxis protein